MKRIPVSMDIWRKLRQIRDEQGFKHFNKTLEWLMWQVFSPEKTTITLEPEIFDRLVEIKEDNNCGSFGETIDSMADELLKFQEMNEQEQGGH